MPRRHLNRELICSRALLELLASVSTVGIPSDALQLFIDQLSFFGPFSAEFVGDLFVVPETSFEFLPADLTLPLFTIFRTRNGQLELTAQVNIPQGVVVPASAVSPNAKRPLVAALQVTEENVATIVLYAFNATGTIVEPISTFELATLDAFVNFNETAELIAGFSNDGRYLAITYSVGPDAEGGIIENRLAILRVTRDGQLEFVTEEVIPRAGEEVLFVQQNIVFERLPNGEYVLIAGYNTFVEDPLAPGNAARLITYRFNASDATLLTIGDIPVNQAIIGYDLHPCLDRLLVLTREAAIGGLSVLQEPEPPFPGAPAPGDELRLYELDADADAGALTLIASHDLGARGSKVRWSNSGKLVAITFLAAPSVPGATGTLEEPVIAQAAPPSVLAILAYDRKRDCLTFEDVKVASPFAFGLAWNRDDTLLGVAGVPSQAQKDIQLYAVNQTKKSC